MPDVRITSNAGQLSARMIARAGALSAQAERAMRENLAGMQRLAVEYSSGPGPSPNPAHPYSRRAPRPALPPYIVNIGRGVFRASWQTGIARTGADLSGSLFNTAPQSRFFSGLPTARMIGRPILQQVIRQSRPTVFRRNVAAVRKALVR